MSETTKASAPSIFSVMKSTTTNALTMADMVLSGGTSTAHTLQLMAMQAEYTAMGATAELITEVTPALEELSPEMQKRVGYM